MNNNNSNTEYIVYLIASIIVIWIALLVAPYISGGLPNLIMNFSKAMDNPFHITWCEDSIRTILIFLLIYGISVYSTFPTVILYSRP